MPLLADYAITPGVFDENSNSTEGEREAWLVNLLCDMIFNEWGVVRDLRAGEWSRLVLSDSRRDSRERTLFKKMMKAQRRRLLPFASALPERPADDRAWCKEALATDRVRQFQGCVVTTRFVKDAYKDDSRVAGIDQLSSERWWLSHSPSTRLSRTLEEYQRHLDPVLRWSNSLMFIDPYLDPGERGYRDFPALLRRAGEREPAPQIEIHRRLHHGENTRAIEGRFREALAEPLREAGLRAHVSVWRPTGRPFHDRYLISNLIGISLPYGFDVGKGETTWTRLGRTVCDDIEREFHEANPRRVREHHFEILGTTAARGTLK